MEGKDLRGFLVRMAAVVAVVGGAASPAIADSDEDAVHRIAPIRTAPAGQTYGRWAAEWWQWAFGVPADANPITDATGEYCDERQVDDDVWFLANSFSADPVVRSCEVAAGKSLFVPLINHFYGAFLSEAPETRTEEFVRAHARCIDPVTISAWIDAIRVPKPNQYFTGPSGSQSPIFNVQMPPDNLLEVDEASAPELVVSPSAEEGYYLFVRPLRPGRHTIRWIASGCFPGIVQDITYHITVVGDDGKGH